MTSWFYIEPTKPTNAGSCCTYSSAPAPNQQTPPILFAYSLQGISASVIPPSPHAANSEDAAVSLPGDAYWNWLISRESKQEIVLQDWRMMWVGFVVLGFTAPAVFPRNDTKAVHPCFPIYLTHQWIEIWEFHWNPLQFFNSLGVVGSYHQWWTWSQKEQHNTLTSCT